MKLLSLIVTAALVLATVTVLPGQARADEPDATETTTTEVTTTEQTTEPASENTPPSGTDVTSENTSAPEVSLGDEPQEGESETGQTLFSPMAINTPQINTDITVNITEFTKIGGSSDEGLNVGDSATISGTWSAPADAVANEQFTVELPAELQWDGPGTSFNLAGDGDVTYGECVVAGQLITCTLTDAVNGVGPVEGEFGLQVEAVAATDEEELSFQVNGTDIPVRTPGGAGITQPRDFGWMGKRGSISSDNSTLNWTIKVRGSELADAADSETGIYVIRDTPSSNHELKEDGNLTLQSWDGVSGNAWVTIDNGITAEQDGDVIDLTINPGPEGWDRDRVYEIKYQTAPTSGTLEPESTRYTNSAELPSGTVGVGEGSAPRPQWKTGSAVESTKWMRYDWTLQVPGTVGAPGETVTISEQLVGNHRFAEDASVTVTGGVNDAAIAPAEDGTSAAITFTLPEGNTDASVYTVRYSTEFAPAEGGADTPEPGEAFTNTASIGGETVSSTVRAGGEQTSKRGALNYDVEPAGTTLDWIVNVDGRQISDLDSDLTLTDTLAGPHEVCADNLNLRARAVPLGNFADTQGYDIPNVSSEPTTDGIEITIPLPAEGFSRDYRYVIEYTTCNTSGGLDVAGTTYGNAVDGYGIEESASATQDYRAWGTGRSVGSGSFDLKKFVTGAATAGAEFTILVEEFPNEAALAANTPESSYEVEVGDGQNVQGQISRGDGWLIRLSEPNPTVNGQEFRPIFKPANVGDSNIRISDDQRSAVVEVARGENQFVLLENEFIPAPPAPTGSITVTKDIEGEQAAAAENLDFPIVAHVDGQADRPYTLNGDGDSFTIDGLTPGAEVTFTETLPVSAEITWGEPTVDGIPLSEYSVTVLADETTEITLTNHAETPENGLKIRKKLSENLPSSITLPADYTVNASWMIGDTQHTGTAVVTAGNTVWVIDDATGEPAAFPMGTEVTLTEETPDAISGIDWADPIFGYAGGDVEVNDGEGWTATVIMGGTPQGENVVKINNTANLADGKLRVTKDVISEDGSSEAVPENAEFVVRATWDYGANSYQDYITVTPGSGPVAVNEDADDDRDRLQDGDIPWGTEVTFEEVTVADAPAGTTWVGHSWAASGSSADGFTDRGTTATMLVSDSDDEGRLISLRNQTEWLPGELSIEKFVVEDGVTVPAADADLPDNASFDVVIESIVVPTGQSLPSDFDLAAGDTITLDGSNDYSWNSGAVLPHGTAITYREETPENVPGWRWGGVSYQVGDEETSTVVVNADETVAGEIINHSTPTAPVDIDKDITGRGFPWLWRPRITDDNSRFEVTLSWGDNESCVLTVFINNSRQAEVVDSGNCDADVFEGEIYLPLDTEITVQETKSEVNGQARAPEEITWSIIAGEGTFLNDAQSGDTVAITLTGERNEAVEIRVTNRFGGTGGGTPPTGPTTPPTTPPTGPTDPTTPPTGPTDPTDPTDPTTPPTGPTDPTDPTDPTTPPTEPNGSSAIGQCIANTSSVTNPLAWLIPIGLLASIGHVAQPMVQPIIDALIAEANAKIRELTPDIPAPDFGSSVPDYGQEVAAELQNAVNAINAELAKITPEVPQEIIVAALVAAGLIATTVAVEVCEEQGYLGYDFAQQ